jgi:hypothetical protein
MRAGWGGERLKQTLILRSQRGVSKETFRHPCFETRSVGALLSMRTISRSPA